MPPEPQLGTLVIVILKARNLIDKHSFYKQDVFAQARLNGTNQKTQVDRKGGQHPLWDTELRFPIMKDVSNRTRKLEVACFSKEHRTDDLLGKGVVDITETLQTGEFDDWVKLNIDGVERGEVYLEMTYFSSGPSPKGSTSSSLLANQNLTRRPSKLPASERLWRPPQIHHPSPNKGHPPRLAPTERQSSPRPSPKNAPLPLLPKHQLKETAQASLPEVLLPGGSIKPKQHTGSTTPPSVPGIGFVPAPQTSDFIRRPSPSPPLLPSNPAQLFPPYAIPPLNNSTTSANPNPYLAQSTTPFQMPSTSELRPDPVINHPFYGTMPLAWDQYRPGETSTGVSFPTYGQHIDSHPTESHERYKIHQPVHNGSPFSWSNTNLENRYQKALPLPQESQPPLASFDKQPVPHLDADRLHNLTLAEKDAARRKEQEKRDLELALRLDKELNT